MKYEEARNVLVILLQALTHASTTATHTNEACGNLLPGFRAEIQKIADRERQSTDRLRESLGSNTVEQASIELADLLAKMIARES
jgi:hypothetical protein